MTVTSDRSYQDTPTPSQMHDAWREWTLPNVLRRQAQERGDACFLRFETGEALSYKAVFEQSCRLAAGLSSLGITAGKHVLLFAPNSVECLLGWFAANILGAAEVPINTASRGTFLSHCINSSGAEVIIIDASLVPALLELETKLHHLRTVVLYGGDKSLLTSTKWKLVHWAELLRTDTEPPDVQVCNRDLAAIMYTSGTSGPAKGVQMSHGQIYLFAYQFVDRLYLDCDDTFLVTLPLFHANAQFMQVYASMIAGCEAHICQRFTATGWLDQVLESGATVSSLLGVTAQFIYNQPATPRDRDHSLRRMITIPMPARIAKGFAERFGVDCVDGYGMTEICVPILSPVDGPLHPGSCGKVVSKWFEVQIVNPETDEALPPCNVGEIVVRPKYPWSMMAGYHGLPEQTVSSWRNFWFHTGDAAYCDEDGYFYYVDRLNDRIRRRGENISPQMIETVAADFVGILEAAAVGVPAEVGDDEILLCVSVSTGSKLDIVALLDKVSAEVPYFAVPRYVRVIDELPKNPSGKILKRILREQGVTESTWDSVKAGYAVRR